jgi:hypothetical protein
VVIDMKRTSLPGIFTLAFASLLAAPASAEEPAPASTPPPQKDTGGLLFGAKVGALVSTGGLDPNARGDVELGYVFPWMDRSFAALVDVGYSAPKASGSQADPRVDGARYDWHLTQQILTVMPTALYRYTKLGRLVPYGGLGFRVYMLQSNVTGTVGGAAIPETRETSTSVGFGLPVGAELRLGPGSAIGELLFEYGSLDHKQTGSTNAGAVSLALGYRVVL